MALGVRLIDLVCSVERPMLAWRDRVLSSRVENVAGALEKGTPHDGWSGGRNVERTAFPALADQVDLLVSAGYRIILLDVDTVAYCPEETDS